MSITVYERSLDDCVQTKIDYYNQPHLLNNIHHPAGFKGTFAFSDYKKIPEVFHAYLQRHFQQYRLRRMDIEKVNELLNTIWNNDGLEQMFLLEQAMFNSDSDVRLSATDTSLLKKKMAYDEVEDDQEMVDKAMKDAIISE